MTILAENPAAVAEAEAPTKTKRIALVAAKGTLDQAYPPLILATTAASLGCKSFPSGTSNEILSSLIFCLARTSRLFMFSSVVRNAFAISRMLNPQSVFSVNATCESDDIAG